MGKCRKVCEELGRLAHGEVQPQHADIDGHSLNAVSSGDQHAGVVTNSLDNAHSRVNPTQHLRRRRMHSDPDVHPPAGESRGTETKAG
jgi:hypothetical protein